MRVGDTPSETWSSRKKVFFLLLASRSVSLRRTHTGDTFSSDGHLWTSRPERRLFFSVFASSLKPSPRYIYFLAGWIWNTGVCVCVWGLQVHLDTHPVRSSRNHIIQQRRRSAGFRVVLVVIWAVWSRMDYMDSGLRYTPKTSVSNLLLCRSGGGSCWLKVVTPCLCFYLLPEWFCSLACLWDIWETVIGQEVEQNLKL